MRRLASLTERAAPKQDWLDAKKQSGQLIEHATLMQKSAREEDRAKVLVAMHLALGDLHDVAVALGAKAAQHAIGAAMDGVDRDAAGADNFEHGAGGGGGFGL